MPVQKYSAMDPGGSWVDDARDTSARWNAARGDQWNQFNISRGDQRTAEDWRKDVALAQLGLNRDMWQGNRADSAAERAEKYGFEREKLGIDQTRWGAQDKREQGLYDLRLKEATDLQKEREGRRNAMSNFDWSSTGITDPRALETMKLLAAQDPGFAQQLAMQRLSRSLDKANRPEDLQMRREDQRIMAAEDAAAALEGGRYAGEKQAGELQRVAARGGMKDVLKSRGQVVNPATVQATAPEYAQIVDSLKSAFRGLDPQATGSEAGAATAAIMQQQITAAANELAKQYGTNPSMLAKLMYNDVVSGVNVDKRTFLSNPLTFWADTQRETAANALREQFGSEQ